MIYQTIYCTYSALEMIDTFQDDYSTLYKICTSHSHVMVNLTDDRFIEEAKVNPFLKFLIKRESGIADTLPDFFDDILDQNLAENPRDFFIVDASVEECKTAREKFGIAIFNENELDKLDKLGTSAKWNLAASQTFVCQDSEGIELQGWSAILKGYCIVPVNSIIIIDNYLYHNEKDCCHDNVLSILNNILPKSLGVDMHILFVLWDGGGGKFSRVALETIKVQIKDFLTANYPYTIKIGLLTHNRQDIFHQRAVITNYHFLETHHGYHAFKHKKIARFSNDLKANWAYSSINNTLGDSEVVWIDRNLKEVKNQRTKNETSPSTRSYNYLIGDCQNRLLD